MNKKSYCDNLFCYKNDRKFKCLDCGTYMCSVCSVETTKNKYKCIDCYISNNVKDFLKEFEDMIYSIDFRNKTNNSIFPTIRKEKKEMKDVIHV